MHIPDDLYMGNAPLTPADPLAVSPYPNQGGRGIGPMGRIYVCDTVPAALDADAIALAQTPAAAGNLVLTTGTDVTVGINGRGETVRIIGTPRALSVTQAGAGTVRDFTITGYDVYGQKMSEVITSVVGATTNGQKAFKQVLSVAVNGATTTAANVGTTDILGCPVRIPDLGYIAHVGYNNTLADAAGTPVAADATDPSTTTTNDVRGTYLPASATDGAKRLVMFIGVPALGSGPSATRIGAFGVNQNLAAQ